MFETDACRHAHAQVCTPVEIKATITPAEEPGVFEGYGAVFGNRDRDGDVIAPGAFAASLKKGLPILLWQHNQKEPIGTFEVVREDKRGLFVRGRLAQVGRGAEAYALLKMGALNGLSIGFVAREASRNQTTGERTIHRADLMEVSLVTFPANDLARVASVKNADMDSDFDGAPVGDARSFERMLRENGFSRSRAKAITAKGFRAVDMEATEASKIAGMVEALKRRKATLKNRAEIPQFVERFLEMTSSVGNRVRLFPGDSKEITIPNVKLGKLKVKVEAPKFADWTCEFIYYDFKGRVPVRRRETLFMKKGQYRNNISVDRGRPRAFNPFSLQDWKRQFPEQLVLNTTRAKFTYLKFDDPSIDNLPQHQSTFSISVRSE